MSDRIICRLFAVDIDGIDVVSVTERRDVQESSVQHAVRTQGHGMLCGDCPADDPVGRCN